MPVPESSTWHATGTKDCSRNIIFIPSLPHLTFIAVAEVAKNRAHEHLPVKLPFLLLWYSLENDPQVAMLVHSTTVLSETCTLLVVVCPLSVALQW